ncbi:hypothetical protein V6B08_01675 [Ferrovibrio sp. MS7]|jgi:hypothetical protein|uniref:hypothetical protein n=1 Tax=Ferrovibrio plantarum TaxID=3119164 RepID=UPI003136D5FC
MMDNHRFRELAAKADERAETTGEDHYVIDDEWGLELISHDELMDGIYAATPRNAILYTARGY